jgi:hypothetical protein
MSRSAMRAATPRPPTVQERGQAPRAPRLPWRAPAQHGVTRTNFAIGGEGN